MTVVIASAVVPTMIAQGFFKPEVEPPVALDIEPDAPGVPAPGTDGHLSNTPSHAVPPGATTRPDGGPAGAGNGTIH